jgi:hypothetical protein
MLPGECWPSYPIAPWVRMGVLVLAGSLLSPPPRCCAPPRQSPQAPKGRIEEVGSTRIPSRLWVCDALSC